MPRKRRPDISRYAKDRDAKTWAWIERSVLPYMQDLLDRAQERLSRHSIYFCDGMGMATFYIDPEGVGYRWGRFSFAIEDAASAQATSHVPVGGRGINARTARYAARFPELVEFMRISNDLDEYLGQSIGEMMSTVRREEEHAADEEAFDYAPHPPNGPKD